MQQWFTDNSLIILLTAGTLFNFFWLCAFKDRIRITWITAIPLAILHTLLGVVCVKVFAVAEAFGDPASIGGMSLYGGVFMMPIAYYLGSKVFKRDPKAVFDTFTFCMIFTLMCARINCIVSGCCYGNPMPFFTTRTVRWPTREMEIIFYVILFICLSRKYIRKQSDGEIYPIYMVTYGIFRFFNEWLRHSDTQSAFHKAHIWSVLAILIGVSILLEFKAGKTTKKETKKGRGIHA